MEACREDLTTVRRRCQSPWRIGKQCNDSKFVTFQGIAEMIGIVYPNIGATNAWGGKLRIAPGILSAVCGCNKRPIFVTASKDNVPGFVANQQGANHAGLMPFTQIDNTDTVR